MLGTRYESVPTSSFLDPRAPPKHKDPEFPHDKYADRFERVSPYTNGTETYYETTIVTYGTGLRAGVRLFLTILIFLASDIVSTVAGALVFVNADDHNDPDIVKRWAAVLMIGSLPLFFGAMLWYWLVKRSLAYSLVNALFGGVALIIFACNVLLLQWAEGHAANSLHTRYSGADGALEAAFVLGAFKLSISLFNVVGGIYSDIDWRPTQHEMEHWLTEMKQLKESMGKVNALEQQLQRLQTRLIASRR